MSFSIFTIFTREISDLKLISSNHFNILASITWWALIKTAFCTLYGTEPATHAWDPWETQPDEIREDLWNWKNRQWESTVDISVGKNLTTCVHWEDTLTAYFCCFKYMQSYLKSTSANNSLPQNQWYHNSKQLVIQKQNRFRYVCNKKTNLLILKDKTQFCFEKHKKLAWVQVWNIQKNPTVFSMFQSFF